MISWEFVSQAQTNAGYVPYQYSYEGVQESGAGNIGSYLVEDYSYSARATFEAAETWITTFEADSEAIEGYSVEGIVITETSQSFVDGSFTNATKGIGVTDAEYGTGTNTVEIRETGGSAELTNTGIDTAWSATSATTLRTYTTFSAGSQLTTTTLQSTQTTAPTTISTTGGSTTTASTQISTQAIATSLGSVSSFASTATTTYSTAIGRGQFVATAWQSFNATKPIVSVSQPISSQVSYQTVFSTSCETSWQTIPTFAASQIGSQEISAGASSSGTDLVQFSSTALTTGKTLSLGANGPTVSSSGGVGYISTQIFSATSNKTQTTAITSSLPVSTSTFYEVTADTVGFLSGSVTEQYWRVQELQTWNTDARQTTATYDGQYNTVTYTETFETPLAFKPMFVFELNDNNPQHYGRKLELGCKINATEASGGGGYIGPANAQRFAKYTSNVSIPSTNTTFLSFVSWTTTSEGQSGQETYTATFANASYSFSAQSYTLANSETTLSGEIQTASVSTSYYQTASAWSLFSGLAKAKAGMTVGGRWQGGAVIPAGLYVTANGSTSGTENISAPRSVTWASSNSVNTAYVRVPRYVTTNAVGQSTGVASSNMAVAAIIDD